MKAKDAKVAIITGAGHGIGAAFLLSEAAGFMTGAELIIDGEMTRKMI